MGRSDMTSRRSGCTIRPIYGFWQRFRDLEGKPKGGWLLFVFRSKAAAKLMHQTSASYSDRGPVFRTEAEIPKRYQEAKP
jgi:hypothetical protein